MKYIVFSYNLLTLCRTLHYTNTMWGVENTVIIYSKLVTPLPEKIKNDYKIIYISGGKISEKRGFKLIFAGCSLARKVSNKISRLIGSDNQEYTIIIFRDNEVQEATIMEKISEGFPGRVHFNIMEEGSGIYAQYKIPIRYLKIKKLIYRMKKVSLYSLLNRTQGENLIIDKIICTNPEILMKRYNNREVLFEQMEDVFTKDLNLYMIDALAKKNDNQKTFDYVFLTQPFTDFRDDYDELLERHLKLLPVIFKTLSQRGKTLIKLHPREKLDYSVYTSENVSIVSEEIKDVPFECLMQMYGKPQMISMFSSVSCSINTNKPSIYLWSLFDIPGTEKLFSNEYYSSNNIITCSTIEDFERALV